jgi:myosin heavy subunit
VWIEDDEEKYLPAKVQKGFTAGEATTVRTEDGEDHKLDAKQSTAVIECNDEVLNSNVQDLINISDLNEMSILHSLRIRFKEDKIYTSISAILVSVNPFRLLPLYTPEILAKYRDGNPRDLAPHVFQSANTAYTDMLSNNLDQSVVISGESGAGKSEAMKLILQFLTVVSGRASGTGEGGNASSVRLEQQILAANPISRSLR